MLALLNFTSFVKSDGYLAIFILSVLQSCCIPASSEITLGFAGVLAGEGKLNLPGVIAVGVAGEVIGAFIAWAVGRTVGRAFIDRYGKYVLLTHKDMDWAERWFQRHEGPGVLGSRLLPGLRSFVALFAGIAEVPPIGFGIFTALGSLIWLGAMASIGYGLSGQWNSIAHGFSDAGIALAVLVVIALAFGVYHRYRSYKAATASGEAES
jgi:membrane protein DedA with SNARE-associated domain